MENAIADDERQKLAAKLAAQQAENSDVGNAESHQQLARIFTEQHRDEFRFSPGLGWMHRDDNCWARDDKLKRYTSAAKVCRSEAAGVSNKLTRRWLESDATTNAVVEMAAKLGELTVGAEVWDRNRYELNTPAGIVDLRTGKMREREVTDYMTLSTAVSPGDVKTATRWQQFVSEVFGGDAQMIRYMQLVLGYCLTGERLEQILLFAYGLGANGKSVMLDIVKQALGTYAMNLPGTSLMQSRSERHPTELAMLRGKRLAISSELEDGQFWAEARIKELTGNATLTARFMRQDFFEFSMTHKHLISGNFKPRMRGGDPAMARRMVLVPFNQKFDGARRDNRLMQKLEAEAEGILGWCIQGAVDWYRDGLGEVPKQIAGATAEYLADQDDFQQWLDDCCTLGNDKSARGRDLYDSYRIFKKQRGEQALSLTSWGARLARIPGVGKRKDRSGSLRTGITLSPAAMDELAQSDRGRV